MFSPETQTKKVNLHHESKVKKLKREYALTRASELYLKGWIQADIAKELGVSANTVFKLLGEVKKRWLLNQVQNIEARKVMELERIDRIEREYWDAWEHSKKGQNKVISTRLKRTTMRGDSTEETNGQEFLDTPGDPRFLEGIQKCITLRSKILGLEEATRIEHSGTINVNNYQMDNRNKLTDEQKMNGIMAFVESMQVKEIEEPYEPVFADSEIIEADSLSTTPRE